MKLSTNFICMCVVSLLCVTLVVQAQREETPRFTQSPVSDVYDMSNATKLTFNVSDLEIIEGVMFLQNIRVEIDPDVNIAELIYVKEEIVIRVSENNRLSVIAGDNGEF